MAGALAARWWAMLSVTAQSTLAATLVDDAVCTFDEVQGGLPPWAEAVAGDADDEAPSRPPLR